MRPPIDPSLMFYAMVTYPYNAAGINGAYVFTTSQEAREACTWANKVYGLVKHINAWEVMAFSEFTYSELVREFSRIQNHQFWQDVGTLCKDSKYRQSGALCDPKSIVVKLRELNTGDFFLQDGELHCVIVRGEKVATVKQLATVNHKYTGMYDKPEEVDLETEVNPVQFTLITRDELKAQRESYTR
jgi:hypothetical protein